MNLSIYKKITEIIECKDHAWLVTVVNTNNSTPGKIGMQMLVMNDGKTIGTIGGGNIEKLVIEKILSEKFFNCINLGFDLGSNNCFIKTGMLCGGSQEIFIKPLFTKNNLYIIGGGHCGYALSELMIKCDFCITVIDNRNLTKNYEQLKNNINFIQINYQNIVESMTFNQSTFIVIMTHSHLLDIQITNLLIDKEYKYLGVIGSKNKSELILENLNKNGVDLDKIKKIFMPIGFDLGKIETPHEIAISIASQLLAVKNEKDCVLFNSNPLFKR